MPGHCEANSACARRTSSTTCRGTSTDARQAYCQAASLKLQEILHCQALLGNIIINIATEYRLTTIVCRPVLHCFTIQPHISNTAHQAANGLPMRAPVTASPRLRDAEARLLQLHELQHC